MSTKLWLCNPALDWLALSAYEAAGNTSEGTLSPCVRGLLLGLRPAYSVSVPSVEEGFPVLGFGIARGLGGLVPTSSRLLLP